MPSASFLEQNSENSALSDKSIEANKTMTEATGTHERATALRDDGAKFFPINDPPKELLVSAFIAVEDPI